jgi:8-oxo-dGTP pyrophosphatase MutT (NUDIX family)
MKLFNVGIKGVIRRDDKVLVVRADPTRDFWEVPGGRIDADEDIGQTLMRELREEVPNIKDIRIGRILDAYRIPRDISPDTSLVLIFYEVQADFDGDPRLSDEHVDYKWASKTEALELVHESCQAAIREAFREQR